MSVRTAPPGVVETTFAVFWNVWAAGPVALSRSTVKPSRTAWPAGTGPTVTETASAVHWTGVMIVGVVFGPVTPDVVRVPCVTKTDAQSMF